ncbi:unnamed protein product [Cercospora beticola]|nr:unnamed protein product [Cercospora beticola]
MLVELTLASTRLAALLCQACNQLTGYSKFGCGDPSEVVICLPLFASLEYTTTRGKAQNANCRSDGCDNGLRSCGGGIPESGASLGDILFYSRLPNAEHECQQTAKSKCGRQHADTYPQWL